MPAEMRAAMSFILRAAVAWHYNDGSPIGSFPTRLRTQTIPPTAEASRRGEPVTCGLPCPRGVLSDLAHLRLVDAEGGARPLQARALDHWPDGSVRWVLLDWLADSPGELTLECGGDEPVEPAPFGPGPLAATGPTEGIVEVHTGRARFRLRSGGLFPFDSVEVDGNEALDAAHSGVSARDDANCPYRLRIDEIVIEEAGPLRVAVRLDGHLVAAGGSRLLAVRARLHFFRDSATVRMELAITNTRAAGHPGGIWHLGSDGAVYLRDLSLSLAAPSVDGGWELSVSEEAGCPAAAVATPFELFQASSGGENWDSSAHVDRSGTVPLPFRGYRSRAGSREASGFRASPIVA